MNRNADLQGGPKKGRSQKMKIGHGGVFLKKKFTKIIDPMKSTKSSIQVFKYSSIQVFKYSNIQLQFDNWSLTNNVKARDPVGSKNSKSCGMQKENSISIMIFIVDIFAAV